MEPTPVAQTERGRRWASTMAGHGGQGLRTAHADSRATLGTDGVVEPLGRLERETAEDQVLAPGATRADGGGRRAAPEDPDPWRTCFERDRDRILHSAAFRRLAGKTQVFVFPADHQRTRLSHALEVAQVATGIARALRLNVALTEAIALGHDCGHGPGGHMSEDALGIFLPDGFDHAVWGADVSVAGLNLCAETLDGIRNHSWSRPAPATPEGEVVSWADRIAYLCHDWEDAVSAGIVTPTLLPDVVLGRCGESRSRQLRAFIAGTVDATLRTGRVGMGDGAGRSTRRLPALQLRAHLSPSRVGDTRGVGGGDAARPGGALHGPAQSHPRRARRRGVAGGSDQAVFEAVAYVAGMTDRFAMGIAVSDLGWDRDRLPRGVDYLTGR